MVDPDQLDETPEQQRKSAVLKVLAVTPNDPEAWNNLFMIYWRHVITTIYMQADGNREQSQDLSQEVFLRLAKHADFSNFRDRRHFERYLRSMCRSLVIDTFRRSKRMVSWDEAQHSLEPFSRAKPSLDKQLADFLEEIHPVYNRLAPEEQKLFDLLTLETSRKEIAVQMNISSMHVAVRIYRLRTKMKQLIAEQGDANINLLKGGRNLSSDENTL